MLDKQVIDDIEDIAELYNDGDEQIFYGESESNFPLVPSVCQFCGEDLSIEIFNVGADQHVALNCDCKGWRDFAKELINV